MNHCHVYRFSSGPPSLTPDPLPSGGPSGSGPAGDSDPGSLLCCQDHVDSWVSGCFLSTVGSYNDRDSVRTWMRFSQNLDWVQVLTKLGLERWPAGCYCPLPHSHFLDAIAFSIFIILVVTASHQLARQAALFGGDMRAAKDSAFWENREDGSALLNIRAVLTAHLLKETMTTSQKQKDHVDNVRSVSINSISLLLSCF